MPYVGQKPADIISTAVDTVTGAFSGNVTAGGTLGVTGAVTANAGVVVDNITIDGTQIDLSSGDLTLDVEGDIILDANGAQIRLSDNGTQFGLFGNESSDFAIQSSVQDKDILLQGNDGGSGITALKLDMSADGHATFKNGVTLTDGNLVVANGHGIDFSATGNGGVSTPNELLDDYEEGTWTPTVTDTDGTAGGLDTTAGNYTRIGRMVHLNGIVVVNNAGSTTGGQGVRIGGLPYTIANILSATSIECNGSVGFFNAFASAVGFITCVGTDGSTLAIRTLVNNADTMQELTWTVMGANDAGMRFSISYFHN